MNTVLTKNPHPDISTVEEKILLEKQLPFNPDEKTGPTIDLYFHELTTEKTFSQKALRFLGSMFLGTIFLITLPFIALAIKLSSKEPVFRKVEVPGRRGIVFDQYRYPTRNTESGEYFGFGVLLKKSGFEKLPSIINVWKGQMDLVGPCAYPAKWCNEWNKQLSDFYKRFALKPGYVSAAKPITDHNDIDGLSYSLKQELRYVLNPSFKKDFRRMFGGR